jgi:hypothetical protein
MFFEGEEWSFDWYRYCFKLKPQIDLLILMRTEVVIHLKADFDPGWFPYR